jgi:hypothetical protein
MKTSTAGAAWRQRLNWGLASGALTIALAFAADTPAPRPNQRVPEGAELLTGFSFVDKVKNFAEFTRLYGVGAAAPRVNFYQPDKVKILTSENNETIRITSEAALDTITERKTRETFPVFIGKKAYKACLISTKQFSGVARPELKPNGVIIGAAPHYLGNIIGAEGKYALEFSAAATERLMPINAAPRRSQWHLRLPITLDVQNITATDLTDSGIWRSVHVDLAPLIAAQQQALKGYCIEAERQLRNRANAQAVAHNLTRQVAEVNEVSQDLLAHPLVFMIPITNFIEDDAALLIIGLVAPKLKFSVENFIFENTR